MGRREDEATAKAALEQAKVDAAAKASGNKAAQIKVDLITSLVVKPAERYFKKGKFGCFKRMSEAASKEAKDNE